MIHLLLVHWISANKSTRYIEHVINQDINSTCCMLRPWLTYSRPTLILGLMMFLMKSAPGSLRRKETLSRSNTHKRSYIYMRILYGKTVSWILLFLISSIDCLKTNFTFRVSHFSLLLTWPLLEFGISPVETCSTDFVHANLFFWRKTKCVCGNLA